MTEKRLRLLDGQIEYWRPVDVPASLTPLQKAVVAARNISAWNDWLISNATQAPETGRYLTDVGVLGEVQYWRPTDVPEYLTPLEKAIIAARNSDAWCVWLVSEATDAPEIGGSLMDVGGRGTQGGPER